MHQSILGLQLGSGKSKQSTIITYLFSSSLGETPASKPTCTADTGSESQEVQVVKLQMQSKHIRYSSHVRARESYLACRANSGKFSSLTSSLIQTIRTLVLSITCVINTVLGPGGAVVKNRTNILPSGILNYSFQEICPYHRVVALFHKNSYNPIKHRQYLFSASPLF